MKYWLKYVKKNSRGDEEPSDVKAKEDTATSIEEIIWYWDCKTGLWFS